MRFTQNHMFILSVNCFHTLCPDSKACRNRLSSTTDTSTRTSHYLNKMIRSFSFPYQFHNLICIYKSVCDSNFKFNTFEEFPGIQHNLQF